jgi:hypothetical protein
MVEVIDFKALENQEGEQFYALELIGDPEVVFSEETKKPYLTARKTSIPTTFNESFCKKMIGRQLPGAIEKEECDPYDYTLENGEVIQLTHTWVYNPSPEAINEEVIIEAALQ